MSKKKLRAKRVRPRPGRKPGRRKIKGTIRHSSALLSKALEKFFGESKKGREGGGPLEGDD